jgi:putative FmdB family regulatory protein
MPIFEYVCQKCQHRFEKIVHGNARPECPQCAGVELEKQLSVFSAVGTGAAKNSFNYRTPAAPCGSCGDPRGPGSCSLT